MFKTNADFYKTRGFQRRIGNGKKPALLIIDLANVWTGPGNAFTCDNMEEIIPANQNLLEAFGRRGLPIIYTTTAYDVTDRNVPGDMGFWHMKIPVEVLAVGSEAAAIDSRIAPQKGEHVIVKKRASAFHGTCLSGTAENMGVDTVVVTGVTAAACVRHTIEPAIADGIRPIAVKEGIADCVAGAVEWNLFDIDAQFGDVEPLKNVLAYLDSNDLNV